MNFVDKGGCRYLPLFRIPRSGNIVVPGGRPARTSRYRAAAATVAAIYDES